MIRHINCKKQAGDSSTMLRMVQHEIVQYKRIVSLCLSEAVFNKYNIIEVNK